MDHEQIDHAADLGGYLSGRISGRTVRRSQVGEEVTPPLSATKLEVRGRWLLNNSIHTGQGIEICRIGRRILSDPEDLHRGIGNGISIGQRDQIQRLDNTYLPQPRRPVSKDRDNGVSIGQKGLIRRPGDGCPTGQKDE